MQFPEPLVPARLLRRYKRFLADVVLPDGTTVTVHCPNTGAMLGCQTSNSRVWLSKSDNPKRKYVHTWELVEAEPGVLVGINTGRTNKLVHEGIDLGLLGVLGIYDDVRPEVKVGEKSRIDFRLTHQGRRDCYMEVKSVTAVVEQGVAVFPDAVSTRASRHVEELIQLKGEGHRAVLMFLVQRTDVSSVRPADEIDPVYGQTLRRAATSGVEVFAYKARVAEKEIAVHSQVPVCLV